MRKFLVVLAILGLVAGACGGDSGASCESVADDAIDVIQDVIDEMDTMTLEELGALDEEPEALVDMERRAEELQDQANELGCTDATMEQLLEDRAGNLTAEGFFGELLVEELKGGGFFE